MTISCHFIPTKLPLHDHITHALLHCGVLDTVYSHVYNYCTSIQQPAQGGARPKGKRVPATTTTGEGYCVYFVNPLSPNVADLQHFDVVLFCGFSLSNAFCPSTELFTGSLLVVPLSQGLVKKAG